MAPFNVRSFLKRWSGYDSLNLEELERTQTRFHEFVTAASIDGHLKYIIMGNLLAGVDRRALSNDALILLQKKEDKEAAAKKIPLCEMGALHLTNGECLAARQAVMKGSRNYQMLVIALSRN